MSLLCFTLGPVCKRHAGFGSVGLVGCFVFLLRSGSRKVLVGYF